MSGTITLEVHGVGVTLRIPFTGDPVVEQTMVKAATQPGEMIGRRVVQESLADIPRVVFNDPRVWEVLRLAGRDYEAIAAKVGAPKIRPYLFKWVRTEVNIRFGEASANFNVLARVDGTSTITCRQGGARITKVHERTAQRLRETFVYRVLTFTPTYNLGPRPTMNVERV